MSDYGLCIDHIINFALYRYADRSDEYYIEQINAYLSLLRFVCENTDSDILAFLDDEGPPLLHRNKNTVLIDKSYLDDTLYDKKNIR